MVFATTMFILITSKTNAVMGLRSFVVLTGSMEPTIPQGSILFTQSRTNYSKGDVVAFLTNGRTVTHRIIKVEGKGDKRQFFTQGDANNTIDSDPIIAKDVIGKSVFSLPYLGKAVFFMRTLPGFIAIIIFPSVLFIASELRSIYREIKHEIEKKVIANQKA